MIPIEVIYAKQTLGAGDSGYGLLLASWGVGMVLGSIVFAALRRAPLPLPALLQHDRGRRRLPGMAAAPTLAVACAAAVVGGAGNGVQWVGVISAVQELTVRTMQARVMSVLESIGAAMPGVGYLRRRPDRHRPRPARDLPRRRPRGACHRRHRGAAAWDEMA